MGRGGEREEKGAREGERERKEGRVRERERDGERERAQASEQTRETDGRGTGRDPERQKKKPSFVRAQPPTCFSSFILLFAPLRGSDCGAW